MKIYTGSVVQDIIGPFEDDETVKLSTANYCDFHDQTFVEWYKFQPRIFKVISNHGNAASHVFKINHAFYERKQFTRENIMGWSPSSLELHEIWKSMEINGSYHIGKRTFRNKKYI